MEGEFLRESKGSNFEQKQRILQNYITNRLGHFIDDVYREYPDSAHNAETYLRVVLLVINKLKDIFPENETELTTLYASCTSLNINDENEFFTEASRRIAAFVSEKKSFAAIEELVREDRKMLNRLCEYQIEDEVVHIHIPLTFIENPTELRSLFVEAMNKLAYKMEHEEEFKNIIKVHAHSWILYRMRKTLEKVGKTRFGFTNLEFYDDGEIGSADIYRDSLIRIYGNVDKLS